MQAQPSAKTEMIAQLRYFEEKKAQELVALKPAIQSEFLRTGRIDRNRPNWDGAQKRYLSYEEVAERSGRLLTAAGEKTHERLNTFHRSIQFPKLVFHRTLQGRPHLGYCHVTAAKTSFAEYKDIKWAFYIANFSADIETEEMTFEKIDLRSERMYFAIAVEKDFDKKKLAVNRAVRGNGLLFRTHDPKVALRNVLLLGAKHEQVRKVIRAL
jgi:hypothetical protein